MGLFLADVVSFLILAAALLFFIVKFLGWLMKAKAVDAAEAIPEPTREEKLLTEIRDLLKARARREAEQKKARGPGAWRPAPSY